MEKTRVEERKVSRKTLAFFQGSSIEIDFVDDFCLPLKERIGVGPFENLFDF